MTQGLEVYNADGTLRNGITTSLGRVLGQQTVSGTGSLTWPYTGVTGNRFVHVVSQVTPGPGVISAAWAYIHTNGTVYYGQADDAAPIILLFMVF